MREVVVQHLKSAKRFSEDGHYQRIIVQANRIITDSTLWSDQRDAALSGLMLRLAYMEADLSGNLSSERLLMPQKSALVKLIDAITEVLEGEPQKSTLPMWEAYTQFFDEFWKDTRPRTEGSDYARNIPFVSTVFMWALSSLEGWRTAVVGDRGAPIAGICNEVTRAVRTHGCGPREHVLVGMIQSLSWTFDFVRWSAIKEDGSVDSEKLEQTFTPLVTRTIAASRQVGEDAFYDESASVIHDTLRVWRRHFVMYFDLHMHQEAARWKAISIVEPTAQKGLQKRRHPAPEVEQD